MVSGLSGKHASFLSSRLITKMHKLFCCLPNSIDPSAATMHHVGHKFHEVFQLKQGRYADLSAAKISEMMKSNSLDVSHAFYMFKLFQRLRHMLVSTLVFKLLMTFAVCTHGNQNAPTQSLLSVVNGILDESIERKNGEIPHVCYQGTYQYIQRELMME